MMFTLYLDKLGSIAGAPPVAYGSIKVHALPPIGSQINIEEKMYVILATSIDCDDTEKSVISTRACLCSHRALIVEYGDYVKMKKGVYPYQNISTAQA